MSCIQYGERGFSRALQKLFVNTALIRQILNNTPTVKKFIAEATLAWEKGKNPATRAFKVIRIFTLITELGDLEIGLEARRKR